MSKVKRFVVFGYPVYYPAGGWSDYRGSFDTFEEARAFYDACEEPNKEIIDLETGEEVL